MVQVYICSRIKTKHYKKTNRDGHSYVGVTVGGYRKEREDILTE